MPSAILVKRIDPKDKDASFDELEELAHSGGYEILGHVSQVRTPDKAFNVGNRWVAMACQQRPPAASGSDSR